MSAIARQDRFVEEFPSMSTPVFFSAAFHVALFVIASIGIPFVARDDLILNNPITVEIVDIAEVTQTTNVAKPVQPKPEPDELQPPPEIKRPPTMKEDAPPDLSEPLPPDIEDLAPPPEQVKPEPAPKPKKPKPKPKNIPKKAEAQKPKPAALNRNLMDVINSVTKEDTDPEAEQESAQEVSQISQLANRMTVSEIDALRRGISPCWNVQSGGRYAERQAVSLRVFINPDMTVRDVSILDQLRYTADSHYRAAADAAKRALLNPACRKLNLSPEKFGHIKSFKFNFDPRDML